MTNKDKDRLLGSMIEVIRDLKCIITRLEIENDELKLKFKKKKESNK